MKARIIAGLLLLLLGFSTVNAQERGGKRFNLAEFQQKRAEFLIDEIGLTEAEAKVFIPVVNELMKKKYDLNKAIRDQEKVLNAKTNATNAEYAAFVDKVLDAKLQEAKIEKEYYAKFKKILSAEKIYKYQKAEMAFMQKALRDRGMSRPERGK